MPYYILDDDLRDYAAAATSPSKRLALLEIERLARAHLGKTFTLFQAIRRVTCPAQAPLVIEDLASVIPCDYGGCKEEAEWISDAPPLAPYRVRACGVHHSDWRGRTWTPL